MKKFVAFLLVGWQNALTYRIESVVWALLEVVPTSVMLSFWLMLEHTGKLPHEKAQWLISYYIIVMLLQRITGCHFEEWFSKDIKNGNISHILLKPFSIKMFLAANELSWKVINFLYVLPILIISIPFMIDYAHTGVFHLQSILLFLLLLPLIYIQRFFISWLISLCAFWFDESDALTHLKWMSEGLFGGSWLPITFFPNMVPGYCSSYTLLLLVYTPYKHPHK